MAAGEDGCNGTTTDRIELRCVACGNRDLGSDWSAARGKLNHSRRSSMKLSIKRRKRSFVEAHLREGASQGVRHAL
jgi:hypothetical protein